MHTRGGFLPQTPSLERNEKAIESADAKIAEIRRTFMEKIDKNHDVNNKKMAHVMGILDRIAVNTSKPSGSSDASCGETAGRNSRDNNDRREGGGSGNNCNDRSN